VSWINRLRLRAGRPTVALVTSSTAAADGELVVATDRLRLEHRCEAPLDRFGCRSPGGRATRRAAGLLRR